MDPVLLSLITADKVIVEEGNKKRTIIGTFTNFNSHKFPIAFPPWYIYVAITNIVGIHNFSFTLNYNKNGMAIFSTSGNFDCPDPRIISELHIPVFYVAFPEPGDYSIKFHIDAKEVGYRLITVTKIPEAGPNASNQ